MAGKISSLVDYLQQTGNEPILQTIEPPLMQDRKILEEKVVSAYQKAQEGLSEVAGKEIFTPYIEAEDINGAFIAQYMDLLGRVQKAPFKVKDDSWLSKVVYASNDTIMNTYDGGALAFVEIVGAATLALIVGVAGTPLGIPAVGLLAGTLIFGNPKLKGERNQFTRKATEYLRDVYRLNIMAQKMEHEVADIRTLEPNEMESLLQKYGKQRIKREEVETDTLNCEEILALTRKYGAMELQEKLLAAQTQVQQVHHYTENMLKAVGIGSYVLKDYVASDLQKAEDLAKVNEVLTDTDKQLEALRNGRTADKANKRKQEIAQ